MVGHVLGIFLDDFGGCVGDMFGRSWGDFVSFQIVLGKVCID